MIFLIGCLSFLTTIERKFIIQIFKLKKAQTIRIYKMQIIIKTTAGTKKNLNVEPDTTIEEASVKINEMTGIDRKQFHLIYKGRRLAEENKMSDYGIKTGTTIHMVIILKGGGHH